MPPSKIKGPRKTFIACRRKTPDRKTKEVKTDRGQDGKRTQVGEAAVQKTTLLADNACQNVGRFFLATRSRNAEVSRTLFS